MFCFQIKVITNVIAQTGSKPKYSILSNEPALNGGIEYIHIFIFHISKMINNVLCAGIKVTSLQPTSRVTHITSHGRPQMTIKQEQGVDPQMDGSPHDMMGAFVDSTTFPNRPTPPIPFPHQDNLYLPDVQNGTKLCCKKLNIFIMNIKKRLNECFCLT